VIKDRAIDDRSSQIRISNGTVNDGCWETTLGAVRKKLCEEEAGQYKRFEQPEDFRHKPTGPSGPERPFRAIVGLFTVHVVGWVREGRLWRGPLLL